MLPGIQGNPIAAIVATGTIVADGAELTSGDMQSGTDKILLSGDMQSGTDALQTSTVS